MARLVYSSGPGGGRDLCSRCSQAPCRCPLPSSDACEPAQHDIRVSIDRSGRKGKSVTVAATFFLSREDARSLLKRFKQKCGCGGTVKEVVESAGKGGWAIEIQGERRDQLIEELRALGYPTKSSGG
jgi:translation initiation factor 1